MALYKGGDAQECPVCYESLSGTGTTLSCGHVFCQDCLVRMVVRDTVTCPMCRHLTFICAQTLEVPVPLEAAAQLRGARSTAVDALPRGAHRICCRCCCCCFCGVCERLRRQRLVNPGHMASQIFIIGVEGSPGVPYPSPAGYALIPVLTAALRRNRRRVGLIMVFLLFIMALGGLLFKKFL